MTDILQSIIQGFTTGIGSGLSTWLIIKRLEKLEHKIKRRNK
jgi:hypothetical protein